MHMVNPLNVVTVPTKDGVTDLKRLKELVDEQTAAVISSISKLLRSN